jgi:hypothetical protein
MSGVGSRLNPSMAPKASKGAMAKRKAKRKERKLDMARRVEGVGAEIKCDCICPLAMRLGCAGCIR